MTPVTTQKQISNNNVKEITKFEKTSLSDFKLHMRERKKRVLRVK